LLGVPGPGATAAPGTTLQFICVIHPWMQGKLKVT
jgi:hypothetical protein